MPLDPSIKALFDRVPELASYAIWEKSPAEAREEYRAFRLAADPKNAIGKTENLEIDGPAGKLGLRVYTPVAAGGASLPALVYFHGGGFVIGDLDTHDPLCRALANDSSCRVISVDYRLAPEHKFPAAVEDCFAALKWLEENASELAVDPNLIAVGGDSAGGNLAAVVCLLAKENGGPNIAFQLLIYPSIKLSREFKKRPFGSGYCLDDRAIQWFYAQYMPEDADPADARLSPIEAKDLSGSPPAYVVTAGFDPLRDEGMAYAEKLKAAGVNVTQIDYPTLIHGFMTMQAWIPLSTEAIAAAGQALKDALK